MVFVDSDCNFIIVPGSQSTARVGHNDGSREGSDWLIALRLAQEAASDWAVAALA